MNPIVKETKYDKLIEKIARKERILVNATRIASFAVLLSLLPFHVTMPNSDKVVNYDGLHPVMALLLLALCYFIELVLHAKLIYPELTDPLTVECDPEKYLALNVALSRPRYLPRICSEAYTYLGNFSEAIKHAKNMITDKNYRYSLEGYYYKAVCEFFLGDYESLKKTAKEYSDKLSSNEKIKPRAALIYQNKNHVLELICAIADNDANKINELRGGLTFSKKSKADEVFTQYINGLAAARLNDKETAEKSFKWVKENAPKTVFASLAEEQIDLLQG